VETHCQTREHNCERTRRCTGTVLGGSGLCPWVADSDQ
jgi:hypothetical protein